MGVSSKCWIDLSHRTAEFNMSLGRAYAAADVAMITDPVYSLDCKP
jgi:hypothetical protein